MEKPAPRSQSPENLWLLSFSLSSPDVGLSHLRVLGGFRLDQCFAVIGLGRRFVLISSDECMGGIKVVERFVCRLRIQHGVTFSAVSGCESVVSTDVGGSRRIWTHPAFRLMVDCQRNSNNSLETWSCKKHSILQRFGYVESAVLRKSRFTVRVLLEKTQRELLACRRKNIILYAARTCVAVKEEPAYSPCVGCKRMRVDEDTVVPSSYQYVRRDNDEKWTLGWA
jgi:hypothetical protein